MNVCFISENSLLGEVSKEFTNLRTEFRWFKMLKAKHYNCSVLFDGSFQLDEIMNNYDVFCIIPSKSQPKKFLRMIKILLTNKKNVFVVQEGPAYCFQEWNMACQVDYIDLLKQVNGILCHNEKDKKFFRGFTDKPIIVLPTIIDVEKYEGLREDVKNKEESVMIGGNCSSWYNGTSSFMVANSVNKIKKIFFPSMGRRKDDEDVYLSFLTNKDIKFFPYVDWSAWLSLLKNVKYGIHLFPQLAASSFVLDCAVLGIPCIGNKNSDIQQTLFPELAVDVYDLEKAKILFDKLVNDETFYNKCVLYALNNIHKFDLEKRRDEVIKEIKKCC